MVLILMYVYNILSSIDGNFIDECIQHSINRRHTFIDVCIQYIINGIFIDVFIKCSKIYFY